MNSPQTELLIKEIAYRASRRGTKELDTRLKPFTDTQFLATLPEEVLTTVRNFLLESEMTLMAHLVDRVPLPEKYESLKSYLS